MTYRNHLHKGPCQSWLVSASLVRMDFLLHFQGSYLNKIWSCYSHDVPIAAAELKIRSVCCTCDLRGKKGRNPVIKIAGSYEGFIPQQSSVFWSIPMLLFLWRMPVRISTLYSTRVRAKPLMGSEKSPTLRFYRHLSLSTFPSSRIPKSTWFSDTQESRTS